MSRTLMNETKIVLHNTNPPEIPKAFRDNSKQVLRDRIDALRDNFRFRAHLLHEEERNFPKEGTDYGQKYRQLTRQFKAEKEKIKTQLRGKPVDKVNLWEKWEKIKF